METYTCDLCNKTFELTKVKVACCVIHGEGECCHYGETEVKDIHPCNTGNDRFWMYEGNEYVLVIVDGENTYVDGVLINDN